MTGPVTANSTVSFVQKFMQFPRQSIPRTLLYSAVANVAFYQLASFLARITENKYPSVDGNKKAACGVVVFGGLTALFNIVQFKLFNFQLSRVVSLAIGVVITAAMTFVYFTLNRTNSVNRANLVQAQSLDLHAQLISEIDVSQESLARLLQVLSIPEAATLTFLYLIRDRFLRYRVPLNLDQSGEKDQFLAFLALKAGENQESREHGQPMEIREAQQWLDEILKDLQTRLERRRV
jgi:hypothetical protein